MEKLRRQERVRRKTPKRAGKHQNSSSLGYSPEQLSAAGAIAERAMGDRVSGAAGVMLLSGGNQALLRLAGREPQYTSAPDMRFSAGSPENAFEPDAGRPEFQLPEFTGRLVGATNILDLRSGGF